MPQNISNNTFNKHCSSDTPYYCNFNEQGSEAHRHIDFYEFSLIVAGSYTNKYHAKTTSLGIGHLIFFSPGQIHSITDNEPNSHHYSFIIKEDFFKKFVMQHMNNAHEILSCPYTISLLDNSAYIYLAHLASLSTRAVSKENSYVLEHLLYNLIFSSFCKLPDTSENTISIYAIDLLRRLDSFHLNNSHLDIVYDEYPISPSKLITDFKNLTGYTIVQYKNIKRMEYAATLLADENYSISSIADMLEISGLGYFSKQFKEQYGMTPKQWQIAHRKKNN